VRRPVFNNLPLGSAAGAESVTLGEFYGRQEGQDHLNVRIEFPNVFKSDVPGGSVGANRLLRAVYEPSREGETPGA